MSKDQIPTKQPGSRPQTLVKPILKRHRDGAVTATGKETAGLGTGKGTSLAKKRIRNPKQRGNYMLFLPKRLVL